KLASGRTKTLEKCVDALFVCAQTKSGDDLTKCRTKARAGCATAFDKLTAQGTALGASLGKPCGDATLFNAMRSAARAHLKVLGPLVASLPRVAACASLTTVDDYATCLLAHSVVLVENLFTFEVPTAQSLLGEVGCTLADCGAAPTPQPTATPGGNAKITQII